MILGILLFPTWRIGKVRLDTYRIITVVGAFFTPIGALVGIMWSSIIGKRGIKFGYVDFLKIGVVVAIPTLFAALGGLRLAVAVF